MTPCRDHSLAALTAVVGLTLLPLATTAHAETRLETSLRTVGSAIGLDGFVQNQVEGTYSTSGSAPPIFKSYLSCVAPTPGDVGCSFDPALLPTPTHWYQRQGLPTSAAAETQADWGVARVRTYAGGIGNGDITSPSGIPRQYYATAMAGWQEDLTYVAPAPGLVTFEVRLHGSWNDYGRLAVFGGIPHYEADTADWIDGNIYDNCIFGQADVSCAPSFEGQSTFIAGDQADNRSGSIDRLLRFSAIVRPSDDPQDDENPTPVGPTEFLIALSAASSYEGSEVDAFSTMSIERVILQPGASISFGSGTQYLVTTVPEPATSAFWLLGLATVAGWSRTRRRAR